jgi:hypothetical protein
MLQETTPQEQPTEEAEYRHQIHIIVEVDGKEKMNLELESLFVVGIIKDGMKSDHAEMATGVSGDYSGLRAAHIRSEVIKLLKEHCSDPLMDLLTGLGLKKF